MAADAKWLATQVHGVAPATTPFTVTQEGTKAVSCGHGKSRYSFAGHQSLAIVDPGTFLNLTTSAGEGLLKDRGYALDGKAWEKARASDGDDRATRPLTDGKAAIHLTVTAAVHGDSPSTELWTVTARTDCLRTG
jgi:hypothetical protein